MQKRIDHRKDERYPAVFEITLSTKRGMLQAKTINLSLGGARVWVFDSSVPRLNSELRTSVFFPGAGRADSTAKVVWISGHELGLAFTGPASPRLLAYTQLEAKRAAS